MQILNRESRTSVFYQLNYVLAVPFQVDSGKTVQFQATLLDEGLEFNQVQQGGTSLILSREAPSPLRVILDCPGPQVSGVKIIANNPACDLDLFGRDSDAVMSAYRKCWALEQCQLIQVLSKIHHLYSSQDHAFKYLWEKRLEQSPDDFKTLGSRPVVGGGLRLMLPPHKQGDEEPRSIEIRIESFLKEPNKMFVETAFVWPRPRSIGGNEGFNPKEYLEQVELFATNEVWNFIAHRPDGYEK